MNKNATNKLVKIRMILWMVVGVAMIGAGALFWNQNQNKSSAGFGGPFELQSTLGDSFSRDDMVGIPSIVLAGFTFCPDVCPATLAQMTLWRQELDLDENNLRIIFVSVDPDRDTNEIMSKYVGRFSSPIIGLTGTVEQVEAAKLSFGIFAEKVLDSNVNAEENANYDMDHTASVLMFDRAGEFAGTLKLEDDLADIMNKLNRLAGN